jgi:hypothetical protein
MNESALLKGQRVSSPAGEGEVEEIIGDKVVVKLDAGHSETFSVDEVADDSNAG